jgi:hypothetical protein
MHPISCKSGKKGHEDCDKGSQWSYDGEYREALASSLERDAPTEMLYSKANLHGGEYDHHESEPYD